MPTIVRYNQEGAILSVCRAEVMPSDRDPVIEMADGEFVAEIEEDERSKKLAPHQFLDVYTFDARKRTLVSR
jgi:hypothetical protein